mgnify:CR=1 FL=1
MGRIAPLETIDIAMLPLLDGRQLLLPLETIAEVRQLEHAADDSGAKESLHWRGQELPLESLDAAMRLPEPGRDKLTTVAVFKADKDSERPFRALAFCGIASHGRIEARHLHTADIEITTGIVGATRLQDQLYLIPDLEQLLAS